MTRECFGVVSLSIPKRNHDCKVHVGSNSKRGLAQPVQIAAGVAANLAEKHTRDIYIVTVLQHQRPQKPSER